MTSIIVVSASFTDEHVRVTERFKRTLGMCTYNYELIQVETSDVNHPDYLGGEFNYNRCLNHGASRAKGDILFFCNNDLEFTPGWLTSCLSALEAYDSVSPFSHINPHPHPYRANSGIFEGYTVGYEVLGWCIGMRRATYEKIGRFDERVRFWCSDNIYVDQLRHAGLRHALVTYSIVNHLPSRTLNSLSEDEKRIMTWDQWGIYNEIKKDYE